MLMQVWKRSWSFLLEHSAYTGKEPQVILTVLANQGTLHRDYTDDDESTYSPIDVLCPLGPS